MQKCLFIICTTLWKSHFFSTILHGVYLNHNIFLEISPEETLTIQAHAGELSLQSATSCDCPLFTQIKHELISLIPRQSSASNQKFILTVCLFQRAQKEEKINFINSTDGFLPALRAYMGMSFSELCRTGDLHLSLLILPRYLSGRHSFWQNAF